MKPLNTVTPQDMIEPSQQSSIPDTIKEIPHYFIAIHNEPYNVPGGNNLIERDYAVLTQMIKKADQYGVKLTLMFTAQWADYISSSPERMDLLNIWEKQGHEIAAHHHGLNHGNWDGYTDLLRQEAIDYRIKIGKKSEEYLGTLFDYIDKLKQINPGINSGCLNDEGNKRELADTIICDTCSGFANFGQPGRPLSDAVDPRKGINDYITIGTYNGILRKWLTHYQITTPDKQENAQVIFNTMQTGVYGVVTHSIPVQAESFYVYMDFLHSKDEEAKKSRTVTQVIEQNLLPEREIPIY